MSYGPTKEQRELIEMLRGGVRVSELKWHDDLYCGSLPNCDRCVYFKTSPLACPSGKCKKHGFDCGVGYYCEDFIKEAE
ncbi:hypothetical protein EEL32_10285 [Brevibacillus laterosporus]|uniref:Uncharacterized protein n=1 Tax=Brevibacillus laterosporus TaxID=1465 RepID=A0A502IMR2_BRELA|nr:hypothetical protein [Brevibacillus laterosporus]QDX93611.1 hypothetical protein EEL30_15695 [Brevibacillus laterosporus]TPG88141.1 hypothetical protein EEL32_10285 [Brevibacillus laterosporus]